MITLSCIIVHVSFIFRSENRRSCNETNLLNYASEVSLNRIGQKQISLVSKNRQGENYFLTYPPAYVECAWEYILFVSKEHTQTKKFPLANLFVWIYVFLFKQKQIGRLIDKNNFFAAVRVKIFFVILISGNKSITFLALFCSIF